MAHLGFSSTGQGRETLRRWLRTTNLGVLAEASKVAEPNIAAYAAMKGDLTDAEVTKVVAAASADRLAYVGGRIDRLERCALQTLRFMLTSRAVSKIAGATNIPAHSLEKFIDGGTLSADQLNVIAAELGLSMRVDKGKDRFVPSTATETLSTVDKIPEQKLPVLKTIAIGIGPA